MEVSNIVPSLDISRIIEIPSSVPATVAETLDIRTTTSKEPTSTPKKNKKKPKKASTPKINGTPNNAKIAILAKQAGGHKKFTPKKEITSPKVNVTSPKHSNLSSSSPRRISSPRHSTSPLISPKDRHLSSSLHSPKSSPRRASIQNYTPRSRVSLQLEEMNDRRILKTPTKRDWNIPSPSFASQSPRFVESRPSSPPVTKYSPQYEFSPSRQSHNNSPFLSTSPRFVEPKLNGSPHIDYSPRSMEIVNNVATISLKSSTKRFSDVNSTTPAVGSYDIHFNDPVKNDRPMSPFKSNTPRFVAPKHTTSDIGSVVSSSFKVNTPESPSSVFKSSTKRFPDPQTNSPSPISGLNISTFKSNSPSKSSFGSTTERFKIHTFQGPSPAEYSSQEISDFVYCPRK